jgi:hypothetical protein
MITLPTDGPESLARELNLAAADIRSSLGDDLAVAGLLITQLSTTVPKIHKTISEAVGKFGDTLVASAAGLEVDDLRRLLDSTSSDSSTTATTESLTFLED